MDSRLTSVLNKSVFFLQNKYASKVILSFKNKEALVFLYNGEMLILVYRVQDVDFEPSVFVFKNESELGNVIYYGKLPEPAEGVKEDSIGEYVTTLNVELFFGELIRPFYDLQAVVYGDFYLLNFPALGIKELPSVMFKSKLCRLAFEVVNKVDVYKNREYVFCELPTKDFSVYLVGYTFQNEK